MKWASVLPVWALVLAAAIVIGVTTDGFAYFTWLPIILGAAIVMTFIVQLSLRTKEGFVGRLVLSTVGSLVILAAATAVLTVTR